MAVDLTDTDLERRKDLLDCQLRLEGKRAGFKLVYSLGELPVPAAAVISIVDNTYASVSIKGRISGMPVTRLFIPYHSNQQKRYEVEDNDLRFGRTANYSLTVQRPETDVVVALRQRYGTLRVADRHQQADLHPGAVLLRSHPEPELLIPSMDGLGGPKDRKLTTLHYICIDWG
jgi:hypothetical protein